MNFTVDELANEIRRTTGRLLDASALAKALMPFLAAQPAEQPRGEVLDAPAKVGVAHFGKGVRWATVIACAQRAYVHKDDPNLTDEQIAAFRDTFIAQPKPEQAASDDVLDALDDAVIDGDEEAVARISARLDGTEQAVGDGIVHAAQRVASFLDHANLDTSALPAGMGSALRKLRDALNAPRPAVATPVVSDEMVTAAKLAYYSGKNHSLSAERENIRRAIQAAFDLVPSVASTRNYAELNREFSNGFEAGKAVATPANTEDNP